VTFKSLAGLGTLTLEKEQLKTGKKFGLTSVLRGFLGYRLKLGGNKGGCAYGQDCSNTTGAQKRQ
jgi:hypothetical protein